MTFFPSMFFTPEFCVEVGHVPSLFYETLAWARQSAAYPPIKLRALELFIQLCEQQVLASICV